MARQLQKQNERLVAVVIAFALLASCAYAPGTPIPLGLGPGLDELVPAFLVVAVAMLAWKIVPSVIQRYKGRDKVQPAAETARQVTLERYARGEITREDFLRMMEDLGAKS